MKEIATKILKDGMIENMSVNVKHAYRDGFNIVLRTVIYVEITDRQHVHKIAQEATKIFTNAVQKMTGVK